MSRGSSNLAVAAGDVLTAKQVDKIRRLEAENTDLAREVNRLHAFAHELTLVSREMRDHVADLYPLDEGVLRYDELVEGP